MRIANVEPRDEGLLFLQMDDGSTGMFDVSPYFDAEVFLPLKAKTEFNMVQNGGYYVEWACGADLSLDTIRANWTINNKSRIEC